MSAYQIELDQIYKDQIDAQYNIMNLALKKVEKYIETTNKLHILCRASRLAANMNDKFVSISYSGTKGRYGLEVRYYLYRKTCTETVQELKVYRGKLYVNGNKIDIGVSDSIFANSWNTFKAAESELINLFYELLPLRNGDKLKLSDVDVLMNRLIDEYRVNWDSIMDAMFEFNKVGGKYTAYYKLLVRFRLYTKSKSNFKALGLIQYHRVSGGNYEDGSRYTNVVKTGNDRLRLTRQDIRKARLGRFAKEYLEKSRVIESIYGKHLILKGISISLQRIASKWPH